VQDRLAVFPTLKGMVDVKFEKPFNKIKQCMVLDVVEKKLKL